MTTNYTKNDNFTNTSTVINVDVSDIILTPLACASLSNEIMKNLLYQKSQIPYPFTWLKNIVNKKRRSLEENSADQKKNIVLYKHFQTVSSNFDAIENVMANISNMFLHFRDNIREVVFVFGVTPFCPQEFFHIRIANLAHGHIEKNHGESNNRKQPKVLRDIFLSQSWMCLSDNSIPCTNTYIFLRVLKPQGDITSLCNDNNFGLSKPLIAPSKTKQTIIYLNYVAPQMCSCCENLEIFQDVCDSESSREVNDTDFNNYEENDELWLQSRVIVHGFKDSFINKISVCELW